MKDLISIIIPVYNGEQYIKETLESCLSQTYDNIEIVIIDDGSTDNTKNIIFKTLSNSLYKLTYINQVNQGLCIARNKGVEISNGDFALFLDADDLLVANAIELLSANINDYDVVFGSWQDFDSETYKVLNSKIYDNNLNDNIALSYFRIKPTVSTALIKRNFLLQWDESLKTWDVTQYFLDILVNGGRFKFIKDVVTSIRQHNNPLRLSILNNHFEPIYSSVFFASCKTKLKNAGLLDFPTEKILDKEIISYIYQGYNETNKETCKNTFKIVNVNLIRNYDNVKKFGIYYFINLFNGFTGLVVFKKLNKFLERI